MSYYREPIPYKSSTSLLSCCGICMCLFMLILPIVVINFSYKYKNEIYCYNETTHVNSNAINLVETIGIFKWLEVYCALNIIKAVCIGLSIMCYNRMSGVLSICGLLVIYLIWYPWIITGSFLFWRDCNNLAPTQLNTMMWVILIMGYCGI